MVFGEQIVGQEYKERQGVYGIVFNELNQIGLIKTTRGHFLPGGGIENAENHVQCIQREFVEETGHCVEVGDYLGCGILYGLTPTTKIYIKIVGYFYIVKLTGEVREKVEEDHEFIWLNSSDAEHSMLLENQSWAISVANRMKCSKRPVT